MTSEAWIAFGALLFTIFTVSGGGLWALFSRMSSNKETILSEMKTFGEEVDTEFTAIRQAAHIEYKDIRKEFNDALAKAYLEMGEGPKAIREKVNQIELFMRDNYLLKEDYARAHDRLLDTIKLLGESIDRRLDRFEKKLDEQREPL